jgi:hypothetical protein
MSIFIDTNTPVSTDTKKFMDYIKVSTIQYFNRGAYGIGYRVKINDLTKSKYNVLSLNNTEETIKCGQLFVKLVPIFDNDSKNEIHDLMSDILGMGATPTNDFLNEIRIQTDVYKKTNNNLEASCPPIVYSNIVNNTEKASRAQKLLSTMIKQMPNDENKIFLERMKRLYEGYPDIKLGIIAMSFAENYDSLLNVLKNTNNLVQQNWYKYLAIYELLRLYDIGYMHGDYHTNNILINTNYKHNNLSPQLQGRALIIDYGLAFKNKHISDDINTTSSVKLHIMTQEKQPQTNENAYTWDTYKWLLDFLHTQNNLNSNCDILKDSIMNFQEQMIIKINENYPEVITRIRNINESTNRGSVLRGGRAIVGTQPFLKIEDNANTTTENNNMKFKNTVNQNNTLNLKSNNVPISNIEFEQLFNPSNMNMNNLVNDYENTLSEGTLILNSGNMTAGTKKKTIKKKKTHIKKRKTIKKMKKMKTIKKAHKKRGKTFYKDSKK